MGTPQVFHPQERWCQKGPQEQVSSFFQKAPTHSTQISSDSDKLFEIFCPTLSNLYKAVCHLVLKACGLSPQVHCAALSPTAAGKKEKAEQGYLKLVTFPRTASLLLSHIRPPEWLQASSSFPEGQSRMQSQDIGAGQRGEQRKGQVRITQPSHMTGVIFTE